MVASVQSCEMLRSVNVLDLPEEAKLKLRSLGYEHCEDLERALLSECIPDSLKCVAEMYNLKKLVKHVKIDIVSSIDLWNFESYNPPVAVFHKGLDKLSRGGFPIGQLTEIYGAPGSGKTQLCLQAAVDVQIPTELGGTSGKSLFISTDLGFRVNRLREIAQGTVEHMSNLEMPNMHEILKTFTVKSILNGVRVIRMCGHKQLFDFIMNLEKLLDTCTSTKLLIIDSFSFPLVCDMPDLLMRTNTIHVMIDKLQELSLKYKFAVLLTNQLTTVISENSEKRLVPSLGETFGHRLHKRILLDEGKACLMKSIDQPQLFTQFQITNAGVR